MNLSLDNWRINHVTVDNQLEEYMDCPIELGWDNDNDNRRLFYRVVPSKLPFWKRVFNNPWKQFKHIQGSYLSQWYSIERFWKDIKPLETLRDAEEYVEEQRRLVKEKREFIARQGIMWPDDLNE